MRNFTKCQSIAFLICVFCFFYDSGGAQNISPTSKITRVSDGGNGLVQARSLKSVLDELSTKYQIYFSYTYSLVEGKMVEGSTYPQEAKNVEETLKKILSGLGLEYEKTGNNFYVIFPKGQPKTKKNLQQGSLEQIQNLDFKNLEPTQKTEILQNVSRVVEHTVTGKVTDDKGEALPGATVVVKGTTIGTISDIQGVYSINVPSEESILIFSFVGYVSKEILVGKQSTLDVNLAQDVKTLEDIVVIGYAEIERKDVTGAISSITGDELRKTRPVTFDQALQGKVAGVVVQQTSGQPGGGINIQIRGLSSFGSSSPLYVIDGIIIGQSYGGADGSNPLATINPADIESIDVLKDASATAIYGSQATNGVIIITTKRGKEGTAKISYEFSTGYQELIKRYPTMDLQEYATFLNDRSVVWGFDAREEFANPQYLGKGTDWQEELFRKAPMSNHVLTVSGGSEKTQYLLSGSYFKQEGIALGSNFNRISLRLNLDNKTTNWLKIGTSLQLTHTKENLNSTSTGVISMALSQTPDNPVRNPDGSFGSGTKTAPWIANFVNPYALALINKNDQKRNQLYGSLYAEIAFLKDFSLRNEVTASISLRTQDRFLPTYDFGDAERLTSSGGYSYNQDYYTTLRNFLTYNKTLYNDYHVNVLLGHEAQLSQYENVGATGEGFVSNIINNISSGSQEKSRGSGNKGERSQESYFGRINLGLFDKYLLTFNVRADGSSQFAPGNRWVNTYSGALAWKVNNENFLQDLKFINELKLRAGYGLTNNQNVNGSYLSLLSSVQTGLAGNAQRIENLGNPGVEWEKTKYANVGLDAKLFNDRVGFSIDFYERRTDGLLMQIPLPLYSGTKVNYSPGAINSPSVNIGSVVNRGFDMQLNINAISKKDFSWRTDFTLSHNKNEVLKLNTEGASLVGYAGADVVTKTVVGGSIGQFYGYVTDGLFATSSDFFDTEELGPNGNTHSHGMPTKSDGELLPVTPNSGGVWYGDRKFKDLNGDGVITEKDQTFLGSPIPKFQLGWGNTFTYKDFDLNIFFSVNVGNKVLNQMRISGDNPLTNTGFLKSLNNHAVLALIDPNGSASDVNNVYVTNPNTTIVGLKNNDSNRNNRFSDLYLEDGSFIRCRNITLGYNVPEKWLGRIHVGSARAYIAVTNAFLITKYKGLDPEVGSWNPLQAGIDSGFYPQARTVTFGINVGLTK
jgi:TonB-dependent starch-binding outer membrane protein SusC